MTYRGLSRLAMQFSDAFLEIAVSLDCLNDLQLLLQYENFILHSMVDGDQSYNSWKRLGDVIGALFALGYHQQNEAELGVAPFIVDLRRAIFARVYSADKNVSIFLGRPPRISRKYCRFYLPGHPIEITGSSSFQIPQWEQGVAYDFLFETQWTMLCAVHKEDVLDLSNSKHGAENGQRAEAIQRLAEAQWEPLPTKFKLQGPLKQSNQSPVISDFLVSARLNYLHILFLLRLVLTRGKAQFDTNLAVISAEMFGIVVEAIMLRNRLSNSGTSLVWKVAYYGLAAAGALCLRLLNESPETGSSRITRSKVLQHLSVLVAEIESGTLVEKDDSNYKLLMSASQTIGNLLDQLLQSRTERQRRHGDVFDPSLLPDMRNQTEWSPWDNAALQEFETDFWLNLAGHPSLTGVESLSENYPRQA
ncbi:hypothetical protein FSARC_3414 [Fusarium sarcochroum]|uniref:Transcription factor domain-containing protein n=1 Tax=Fusarium sarcochroum TaxID=1208366 RepID=A0A8H4U4F6_9HYPO|nr:hypothetical protein FSARC_3414 [Fusarium sarcochroum]